ncbi:hypothetical protein VSS74_01505 [Conexibacter stalactiti]|uniref:Helix-turn-helix domain-containing protein n=1 Tax=Conexibacter stalactiti TaxID=1940611 RepID=A0ABU4HJW6_9ACTN|nr:hypothetical protein [Conexibacter stalactiti]MDW5592994.1 hypothetical protein [Conexibacter stalactiti]MEC5033635.1 hypothetical protein [Conexibacter stalactiti]
MSVEVVSSTGSAGRRCEICGSPPQAGCGTCARRSRDRRRGEALQLVRSGTTLRRAAREAGVDREALRRALTGDQADETISNGPLRLAVEHAMRRGGLSLSEIARRADPPFGDATQVARLIGRIRTPRCRRGERFYPPRYRTEISVDDAVRVARAAGIDPIDIEGL